MPREERGNISHAGDSLHFLKSEIRLTLIFTVNRAEGGGQRVDIGFFDDPLTFRDIGIADPADQSVFHSADRADFGFY